MLLSSGAVTHLFPLWFIHIMAEITHVSHNPSRAFKDKTIRKPQHSAAGRQFWGLKGPGRGFQCETVVWNITEYLKHSGINYSSSNTWWCFQTLMPLGAYSSRFCIMCWENNTDWVTCVSPKHMHHFPNSYLKHSASNEFTLCASMRD